MLEKIVSQLNEIRNKKTELQASLKELEQQNEYLEQLIISELKKEGLTKATTAVATVSIKIEAYPNIADWDKALEYIISHKEYILFKKQINKKSWQEIIDAGGEITGIEKFEKTTLLFRRSAVK